MNSSKLFFLAALLAVAPSLPAQNFELRSVTIANGGGTSAGGNYKFTHTVGQQFHGLLTGTSYSASLGFWPQVITTTPASEADLQLRVLPFASTLHQGELLTVGLVASNAGPATATSVQLTFRIPAGAVLQSITSGRGSCAVQGSSVTCSVAALAPQQSFNVEAVASVDPNFRDPNGAGFICWWCEMGEFRVSAAEADGNLANNQAAAPVTVHLNLDFAGAVHTPLGHARLNLGSNGLAISNLGTSGQDGVSIALGEAEGWRGGIAAPLTSNGTRLNWSVRGTVNGSSNQPVSLSRMEVIADEINVFADFSAIGASNCLVLAFNNGAVVASNIVPANSAAYRVPGSASPQPFILAARMLGPSEETVAVETCWNDPLYPGKQLCPVALGNGPTVLADLMRVTPVDATASVSSVSRLEILGAWNTGSLVVRGESVQKFGLFHTALGQAQLGLSGDVSDESGQVALSNLGTNGQDGVATELDANGMVAGSFSGPNRPRLSDPDVAVRFQISGTVSNSVSLLGTLAVSNLTFSADFSPIGASSFLLEIWNGSQFVGSTTVKGSVLGTLAAQPGGTVEFWDWYWWDFSQPLGRFTFGSSVTVTPTGGVPLVGNVLQITALNGNFAGPATRVEQIWIGVPQVKFAIPMRDYGDAPTGYPVTLAEGGASHSYAPQWRLGRKWDRDFNGHHSVNSVNDDLHGSDDEDGIVFQSPLVGGQMATAIVTCGNVAGFLDAWADFNNNGSWAEAGEQIFASQPLLPGPNTLTFLVPVNAVAGSINTRWRLSATGGLSYTGHGGAGEIEDHTVTIGPPPVVVVGNLPHVTLGNATVSSSSNMVSISNLGSNGQDGVMIDLGELSRTISLGFGSNGFSLPGFSKLTFATYGTVSGTPDQFLGSTTWANSNGVVNGIFTRPTGNWFQSLRIEVYNGGTLVGTYPMPGDGSIGTLSGDVHLTDVRFIVEPGRDAFWCYDGWWWFSPPGQPSMASTATQLRLVYVGSSNRLDNLARLVLGGCNIDSILIQEESAPRFQPRLHIDNTSQRLQLTWDTRSAILLRAPTIDGLWTRVLEGTNRLEIESRTTSAFFRLATADELEAFNSANCFGFYGTSNVCQRNILLIIVNDMGVDQVPRYIQHYSLTDELTDDIHVGTDTEANPRTSMHVLSKLSQAGVTFLNAWTSPVDAEARASLYTGLNAFRHKVYSDQHPFLIQYSETYPFLANFTAIASMLTNVGYNCAFFGKWYLGDLPTYRPLELGWSRFAGTLWGVWPAYNDWEKADYYNSFLSSGGVLTPIIFGTIHQNFQNYATGENVTNAIDWISTQTVPWMATIAFDAPHSPYHTPPYGCWYSERTENSNRSKYRGMLECLDIYLGNLLSSIPSDMLEQTTIILLSNNGTPVDTSTDPASTISEHFTDTARATKSLYEGRINVPLIIADGYSYLHHGNESPSLKGRGRVISPDRTEAALVQTMDVYATIAAIGRADGSAGVDSVSLVPYLSSASASKQRHFIFAENRPDSWSPDVWYCGNDGWDMAIRSGSYKLIVKNYASTDTAAPESYELYDLSTDRWEKTPLSISGSDPVAKANQDIVATLLNRLNTYLDSNACSH